MNEILYTMDSRNPDDIIILISDKNSNTGLIKETSQCTFNRLSISSSYRIMNSAYKSYNVSDDLT